MRYPTHKEIIEKCEELWPDATDYNWGGDTPAIQIHYEDGVIKIIVGTMYNWGSKEVPQLTFEKKLALSEFFDTMLVEETSEFEASFGCETCEYGGAHGFIARIEDGAPYDPLVAQAAKAFKE